MSIPFVDREPEMLEIEHFRLLLSRLQGGLVSSPMFQLMHSDIFKKMIVSSFNLPNSEHHSGYDILIQEEDRGLKCKIVVNSNPIKSALKDVSCPSANYWNILSDLSINRENYREYSAEIGLASIEILYKRDHNESINLSKSSFLSFFTITDNRAQLCQYPYFIDPQKLNWQFVSDTETQLQAILFGYDNESGKEIYKVIIPKNAIEIGNNQRNRSSFRPIRIEYLLPYGKAKWCSETFHIEALSEDQMLEYNAIAIIKKKRELALAKLEKLIEGDGLEIEFQKILAENWWMLGNEYGELLSRRKLVRDSIKDFVVRRTADGFLEIIEIKRPINSTKLFKKVRNRDFLYPGSELSEAIGQVIHYIDQLDSRRYEINFTDKEDINKVRAKLIIGRDKDSEQIGALRNLNSHLYRIEILTYDQLLRVAKRSLEYL